MIKHNKSMDFHLLMLFVATALFSVGQSQQAETNNRFAAGRSEQEFNYVKSKIQEIEQVVIKKLGKDKKNQDVAYQIDTKSKAYENMLIGAIDDILLTAADADEWLSSAKGRQKRKIFNFDWYPERKWTMPIKFIIDKSTIVNVTSQGIIRDAIAAWELETCVKFQEVWSEPMEKYLFFTNAKGGGCKSFIGKTSYIDIAKEETDLVLGHKYRQPVFLEDPGCYELGGIPIHEIGHALGLYHEAQRTDRNKYIRVFYDNIKWGEEVQFTIPTFDKIDTKGIPYDLGSIMHYGALEFSSNAQGHKYVILPHETNKYAVMGQRAEIGFYDAKIINLAYCQGFTNNPNVYTTCLNHGYQKTGSAHCRCPVPWIGQRCENLAPSSPGCAVSGGEITHTSDDTDTTFSLYSPNYKNFTRNGTFTPGDHCFWKIQVPFNYQIVWWIDHADIHDKINFTFGLMLDPDTDACLDWLEIRKQDEFRGRRICGLGNSSTIWKPTYSYSHILHIDFRSFTNNLLTQRTSLSWLNRGFHLRYQLKPASATEPQTTTTRPATTKYYWDNWTKESRYTPSKPVYHRKSAAMPIGITSGGVVFFLLVIGVCYATFGTGRNKPSTSSTGTSPTSTPAATRPLSTVSGTTTQNIMTANGGNVSNPPGNNVRRVIREIGPGMFEVSTVVIGESNIHAVRPNTSPIQPPPYTPCDTTATGPEDVSPIVSTETVAQNGLHSGQGSGNGEVTHVLPGDDGYTNPSIDSLTIRMVTGDGYSPDPPQYSHLEAHGSGQGIITTYDGYSPDPPHYNHLEAQSSGQGIITTDDGYNPDPPPYNHLEAQSAGLGIFTRLKNVVASDREQQYQRFNNEV